MNTVTKESVVVYNNQKYKVTLEVTKLEDQKQPLSEGMFMDYNIKNFVDPSSMRKILNSRNIVVLHNALDNVETYIAAVGRLRHDPKTKHKTDAKTFYFGGSKTTKYTEEELKTFAQLLRQAKKDIEKQYHKMGGDQTYYTAMAAEAQRQMADQQMHMMMQQQRQNDLIAQQNMMMHQQQVANMHASMGAGMM